MKHRWVTHQNCERPYCPICDGALSHCEICNLAEGQLTDDCPGVRVPVAVHDTIYQGRLNFRSGAWHHEPNSLGWADARIAGGWLKRKRNILEETNHHLLWKDTKETGAKSYLHNIVAQYYEKSNQEPSSLNPDVQRHFNAIQAYTDPVDISDFFADKE